jgi:hypothetical protein
MLLQASTSGNNNNDGGSGAYSQESWPIIGLLHVLQDHIHRP